MQIASFQNSIIGTSVRPRGRQPRSYAVYDELVDIPDQHEFNKLLLRTNLFDFLKSPDENKMKPIL